MTNEATDSTSQQGLLTTRQAAVWMGLTARTIRGYIKSGILMAERLPGGQFRIHPDALKVLRLDRQSTGRQVATMPTAADFNAIINAAKAKAVA